jgi:methionine-rich copper-binding protein CopC
MRPVDPRPARHRLLVVLTLIATLLPVGAPARAEGGLTASDPANGGILDTAPAVIELNFDAVPEADYSHVTVLDGTAGRVNSGALSAAGTRGLRQPVDIKTSGDFIVAYHVEFRGGGQTRGFLRFSVGTGLPPAPAAGAVEEAAAKALTKHRHTIDPASAVLLVIDGLVVLGVLIMLMIRKPIRPAGAPVTRRWSVDI